MLLKEEDYTHKEEEDRSKYSEQFLSIANNKRVDQTARLICTFIVRTCSLQVAPGVFSLRGSNIKVGYIVPSDYLISNYALFMAY